MQPRFSRAARLIGDAVFLEEEMRKTGPQV